MRPPITSRPAPARTGARHVPRSGYETAMEIPLPRRLGPPHPSALLHGIIATAAGVACVGPFRTWSLRDRRGDVPIRRGLGLPRGGQGAR